MTEPAPQVSDEALRLHRDAVVVDLHADTPSEFFLDPGYDFAARHDSGHVDLPRLRDAGIDVQFLIAWAPAETAATPGAAFRHVTTLIEATHRVIARTPGIRLATDTAGIHAARAAGDVAAMIGIEGGHAIESSIERLHQLHEFGARYLTLTWNNSHDWADAAGDAPRHGGLSRFGRDVVREMGRLRMLVDLSHAAESTFWDALDAADGPVIASHSNARARADHHRNLSDEQLRELAATGGVVGVNAFPAFLDTRVGAAFDRIEDECARLEARRRQEHGDAARAHREARDWRDRQIADLPPVSFHVLAEHLDHMADVAGIDHVALGLDFDGIPAVPAGLPDCAALPRLTDLLLQRGWRSDDLHRLLGANALRVLAAVTG